MKNISIEVFTGTDYIYAVKKIDDKTLEFLKPTFEAIKNFKPYEVNGHQFKNNFPTGDAQNVYAGEKDPCEIYPGLPDDAYNLIIDYAPYCNDGFLSITSVKIFNDAVEVLV